MGAKVLTSITDKNGKHTSVWRNADVRQSSRLTDRPAPTVNRVALDSLDIYTGLLTPRSPYLRMVEMDDGSTSLYVEAHHVETAIAHDFELGLSYRLPVDELLDEHNVSPYHREVIATLERQGDLYARHEALRDAFGSKDSSDIVAPWLARGANQVRARSLMFDRNGRGEKVVTDENGEVTGYLYHFRDSTPVELEELRPDLDNDADYEDTEEHLAQYQDIEDGEESALRDDYFDEITTHIELYGHPKAGTTRLTFFTEDSVIKFPKNFAGVIASAIEYRQYIGEDEGEFEGVPVAQNEMRFTDSGMPYLVMERVDTDWVGKAERPTWMDTIDEDQAGINAAGELVAFDL